MSILNYVKRADTPRPKVNGTVRQSANLSMTEQQCINDALSSAPSPKQKKQRHGVRYSFNERIKIGNYARFNSIYKAANKYHISYNTAKKYKNELVTFLSANRHVNVKDIRPTDIPSIVPKKGGRPPLLAKRLRHKAKAVIKGMRESGIPVNNNIIAATLDGVIRANNPHLLALNGGNINPRIYARAFRRVELGKWSFRAQTAKRRPSSVKQYDINRWRYNCN